MGYPYMLNSYIFIIKIEIMYYPTSPQIGSDTKSIIREFKISLGTLYICPYITTKQSLKNNNPRYIKHLLMKEREKKLTKLFFNPCQIEKVCFNIFMQEIVLITESVFLV